MNIAVIGGSGYIGQSLISELTKSLDHHVISLSLNAESIDYANDRVVPHNTDIFDTKLLRDRLKECDVVYYLVHMMAQKERDFAEAETDAASSLVNAIKDTNVKKIIFLGGLGNDKDKLSKHLASRHHTGTVLRQSSAQVIEFRASMVVGKGSISYDIIANLVHRLPILTLPSWAHTMTQPIGLSDAIKYLVAALHIPSKQNEIVEIGGPYAMSYESLMRQYAKWKHTKAVYVYVPFIPVAVASWWLNMFTPGKHAKVGRVMVESLANPMVVTNENAKKLFPQIHPRPVEECFV